MKVRAWLAGGALVLVSVMGALGCDSYEVDGELAGGDACSDRPWDCGAEYTCGFSKTGFVCVTTQPNREGDSCVAAAGAPGCDHDLVCVQSTNESSSHCREFCSSTDATHRCPQDRSCVDTQFTVGDKVVGAFSVCIPL